ncbi:MAG: efflux RND transporter permease subunit [Methanoregula sp.]|nr:efflux RND transporter permease subunit [Methanoregula sp.]
MDANAKDQFRWKFYHLAVELNIIILLVAVSVLIFFILPARLESYRLPLIAVMLIIGAVISLDFRKRYRETKAWLHEQPDKSDDKGKEE